MTGDLRREIETITARTGESIERMFQDTSKRMETQLVNLDEELSKELTKSLGSLGSQLTSLSSKFVEDYTPLTEKLKDVVNIASSFMSLLTCDGPSAAPRKGINPANNSGAFAIAFITFGTTPNIF